MRIRVPARVLTGVVTATLVLFTATGCSVTPLAPPSPARASERVIWPTSSTAAPELNEVPPTVTTSVLPALRFAALKDFHLRSYRDAIPHAEQLVVKGRAPWKGYSRKAYGQAWSDNVDVPLGHNHCRTREDILARDLYFVTYRAGSTCVVESGILIDPYTGKTLQFQRGPQTSSLIQIDHVVALGDSWQKGAQQWSMAQRRNFANDPRNLLAVDGAANQQKGAGDTATWLPQNKAFRCEYVTRQVEIKFLYGLWVTAAEQQAMLRVLRTCP